MFENAPVQLVHAVIKRQDATCLCPRRVEFQFHCVNDPKCFECGTDFVDLSDLHELYLCGVLGRHLGAKNPLKSGRRRVVMVQQFGNVEFEDVDQIKMAEHLYGEFIIVRKFCISVRKRNLI